MAELKNNRKQFRMSNQVTSILSELAERLGKSEASVVSFALFYFKDDESRFLFCPPELGKNMWIKEEVLPLEGIHEFICDNGSMWVDVETWEIVKVKVK